jgi:hypothetical protein
VLVDVAQGRDALLVGQELLRLLPSRLQLTVQTLLPLALFVETPLEERSSIGSRFNAGSNWLREVLPIFLLLGSVDFNELVIHLYGFGKRSHEFFEHGVKLYEGILTSRSSLLVDGIGYGVEWG